MRDAAPGQSMRCTDVVPEIRPNRITSPVTTGFSPRSRSARAVPVDPADECRRTRARATSSPGTNPSAANSNRLGRATAVGVSCGGANGDRGCGAGAVRISAWTLPSSSRTSTRVGDPSRATSSVRVCVISLRRIGVAESLSPLTVAMSVSELMASRRICGSTGGTTTVSACWSDGEAGGFGGVRRVRRRLKRSRPHERERWKTLEGDFLGSCQQGALPTMPLHSRRGDGVSSESLFPFRKIVSCLLPFHCEI